MQNVKSVLDSLLTTDGIHEALIVGRDGFVIEHAGDMESDSTGAIMSTAIGAIEAMGRDLEQGNLFEIMAEYDNGTSIVAPIGRDAVLGIVANKGSNLGGIRFAVKKYMRELESVL